MDVNSDMHDGLEKNSVNESSNQVTDNQSVPIQADVQTYPCPHCGRCFLAEALVEETKMNQSVFFFKSFFLNS